MTSTFDRWLTRDPAYHGGWSEVHADNPFVTHPDEGAMYVAELSCCSCDKLVAWDCDGFTPFMMEDGTENFMCVECFAEASKEIE